MNMGQDFQYDVFLSHSAKDKAVVQPLAERLRKDNLSPCVSGILHSPFCRLPFPKGSLAQFLYINWRSKLASQAPSNTETALDKSLPVLFNPTELCE